MNAPFLSNVSIHPTSRRRGIFVEYLSERYHRAFDDEVSSLMVPLAMRSSPALTAVFDALVVQLRLHEAMQERRLFPAYEAMESVDRALFEAWFADAASLAERLADVRSASAKHTDPLCRRVIHFASEVERHLVDEFEILASWAGASH